MLIHDAQYDEDEYDAHYGWGHCTIGHALEIAKMTEVRKLVAFHHDPSHDDAMLDRLYERVQQANGFEFELHCGPRGRPHHVGLKPSDLRQPPVIEPYWRS